MKHISNKNRLKIGIIGCGKMGQHHIKAIKLLNNADIVALSDPKPDIEKLKVLFQVMPKIFYNPEELLKTEQPDVVHITTPPSTHFELAKLALTYGANIYIEKPFTLKKSEAEEVLSLAKKNGLKVCAGHQVLFEEPARETEQLLKEIGQIVHVESYFSFRTVRRNISPVDQLIDILPHPVYLLLHFLSVACDNKNNYIELSTIDVKSSGEVRGIIRVGDTFGILIVTLRGRPIESYLKIVGTNGSICADFVRGIVVKLSGPGASAIPIILNPYKQAKQIAWKSTKSFVKMVLKKQKSYPGLAELTGAFYSSIIQETSSPLTNESILTTVAICETIGNRLRDTEKEAESHAEMVIRNVESKLPPVASRKGMVLVTGGTGLLGRKVISRLRNHGLPVRVIARRIPPFYLRIPGIQYNVADLSEGIPVELFNDVEAVVHCAAETAGGKEAHEINSIRATKNIMEASIKAEVNKFIHISSIAVLKPSREVGGPLDENSPIDIRNDKRGPYVWGKAESERLAVNMGAENGITVKIIRLGPLVDFEAFEAPGRLGREIGNTFFAVGKPKGEISLCKVQTAAEVIHKYVINFEDAPAVLNLVEPTPVTRGELTTLLLKNRPDLSVRWIPHFILKILSIPVMLLQTMVFPGKKPIDIYAAFASEKYKTDLAEKFIGKSGEHNG